MLTALVTGGNRGLGLEVARGILAAAPTSHVLLGSRDLAAGQVAAAELAREYGAPLQNFYLNGVDGMCCLSYMLYVFELQGLKGTAVTRCAA